VSRAVLPAVAPLALALALTGCAGTAPADAGAATGTSAAAPSSSGTPSAAPSAEASSPAGTRVAVSFAGGRVEGGGRIPVPMGGPVTLQVTSDVADEVHVHGYDLSADVAPGSPATVTFDATVPGVFEVELEHLGEELLTLQVQ
jgi:hypothetical protein